MRSLIAGSSLLLLTASLSLIGPAEAVPRAAAASITITVKNDKIVQGKKVVVTGQVSTKKIKRVVLQQKSKGKAWKVQDTAKVKGNRTFKLKDKPTTATTRKYRVVSVAGPKAKSSKTAVGVYAWKDLTKEKVRMFHGWSVNRSVTINGVEYKRALRGYTHVQPAPSYTVDYNVNNRCIALRARLGLSDTSDGAGRATISVVSDDVPVYAKSFGLKESEQVTVPLNSPFRVGLSYTIDNPANLSPAPIANPVAAQPEILCTSVK